MQTVSAYLLERTGLSEHQLQARITSLHDSLSRWLQEKGATDVDAASGTFASETPNGGGSFTREAVSIDGDYAEIIVLREKANASQVFITRVSFVGARGRVAVYSSVSAGNIGTTITPRSTSARCPSVIRQIIRDHGDWTINQAPIPSGRPRTFSGAEGGAEVCKIIASANRKFPLVLVSEDEGSFVWDGLDRQLAYDLAGLGYVSVIDDEAGREILTRLGRRNACFDGAVRIYWPHVGAPHDPVMSTLWTAERMLEAPANTTAEQRFREQVRRRIMMAAALAITEPAELGEVFRAHARKRLAELQGDAAHVQDVWQMANTISDDLDSAKRRIAELETELGIEITRAENAEAQLAYAKGGSGDAEPDEDASDALGDDDDPAIQPGETVFYKKTHSAPGYDIMVRRGDCGHDSWENANSADKAWKGVERHEGRKDWSSFMHCSRCKGGGVWRVTW
ncbi:hypothetical protein [Stenotrophomonas sp.]|uniref:hypothetical protein n=1 Tax=Stenotrophomonas sp. TaxID=69392 RepID=UPI0019CC392F|nr:hypothetical protein [Stenotrophomonas sp.]MBD3828371.1 hypothetical protein [Stenotrophomonas sp.]